ncbi:MAG: RluA family pseudouridine synthase [Bdellovibrionota bacterium]|nr:RluA family pseudouridine synthase [Bdellovibrionota bacterium]
MSQKKTFQFETPKELDGYSLKESVYLFLKDIRHIPISKREVKKIIDTGGVHLNGDKRPRASRELSIGDRVLIFLPREFLLAKDEEINIQFELSSERVVFEDDAIIVVNKPSGLNTQASLDPKRDHLYAAVKRYLMAKSKHPDKVYAGLHHRLDVDTSGLVLFTKKKSANKNITKQFEGRTIQKEYIAISLNPTEKIVQDRFIVENHLARKKSGIETKQLRMESVQSGGDYAKTEFIKMDWEHPLLSEISDSLKSIFTKLQCLPFHVKPKTGRTHQIRVHLFESELPILGDPFYFIAESSESYRLMLHAAKLSFVHPLTEENLSLEAKFLID